METDATPVSATGMISLCACADIEFITTVRDSILQY